MQAQHAVSAADRQFLERFLDGELPPAEFHHPEHVRLAYVFVVLHGPDEAFVKFREALQAFLARHGIDPAKYHETMTRAWLLAVIHFMQQTPPQPDSATFVATQPTLLDSQIMLTHYSKDVLRSAQARTGFVAPDLDPIPEYPIVR